MNKISVKIPKEELYCLINILNEVCNGIYIDNFEKTIGFKEKEAINFLDNLLKEENKNEIYLNIDDKDLILLKNSFKKVFKEIDDWEFQTRTGFTKQEAEIIQQKIIEQFEYKL